MSVTVHSRSEVGSGVATHMLCQLCGHLSRSHAHQLSHVAATHPASLDGVMFGRLGNILIYQSTAKLFHCAQCFYTCRDFTKLYSHIISIHCEAQTQEGRTVARGEGGKTAGGEEEEGKMVVKSKEKDMKSEGKNEVIENKNRTEKKTPDDVDQEVIVEKSEEEEQMVRESKETSAVKIKVEEGDLNENSGAPHRLDEDKPDIGAGDCVLTFDGIFYHCLICGFRNKMKVLGLNHVVKKHNVPRGYAGKAIRREDHSREDIEDLVVVAGLSKDLLKEEKAATAKVVRFTSNRYECLICGWKTKLKGFAISHVVRNHDVERPYSCQHCSRSFFVPSRLQQHTRAAHPPGRYACPFCCFKTNFMGGFRRHCSRCNARDLEEGEEEEEEQEETAAGVEAEDEEKMATRGGRKRQRTARIIKQEEEDQEERAQDGKAEEEEENKEEWMQPRRTRKTPKKEEEKNGVEWMESRRTRKTPKTVRVMDKEDK